MSSPTLTFTPAMFHASLKGLKNTTRRLITADCFRSADGRLKFLGDETTTQACPHQPGQIKPMVTSWAAPKQLDNIRPVSLGWGLLEDYSPTGKHTGALGFDDGYKKPDWAGKSRPARFFPKSLYPLAPQVEILTVTPEFLHDITEDGARNEGIYQVRHDANGLDLGYTWSPQENSYDTAREAYFKLWDTITAQKDGGKYAAQHNPACWVITYRLLPLTPANI